MTKKVIEMLKKIEIKLVKEEKLNKKEMDLIRALIRSAIMDLGGITNDNNGTRGTKEN